MSIFIKFKVAGMYDSVNLTLPPEANYTKNIKLLGSYTKLMTARQLHKLSPHVILLTTIHIILCKL